MKQTMERIPQINNQLEQFTSSITTLINQNNEYSNAIQTALKKSKFRLCFLSIAIMVIGVLFVLLAPNAIRYVSLNIMFMAVVLLAVSIYVVPFIWSMLITYSRKRKVKNKK